MYVLTSTCLQTAIAQKECVLIKMFSYYFARYDSLFPQ